MRRFKRFTALVLVLLLMASMLPGALATETEDAVTYTEEEGTVFAVIRVNIRSGPGTNYEILGVLGIGESIERTAKGSNGWSKVVYNGQEAYMYSAYLSRVPPSSVQAKMDYAALTKQIAIVNGLKKGDYTRSTWTSVEEALEKANKSIQSTKQEEVDEAAANLKAAIDGLLKVDYTALNAALEDAREFVASQELYARWTDLVEATAKGKVLLDSGDQLAADAAAAEINEILADLRSTMSQMGDPQVITKEVEVEVPPKDPFCNIPRHMVWPVLFFVSLALNVLLAAVAVMIYRKKRNQTDNMPLVDYNIDDDL